MKRPKFEFYKAKDGWRWRLKAANGKIIAESGEAYKRIPYKAHAYAYNAILYSDVVVVKP